MARKSLIGGFETKSRSQDLLLLQKLNSKATAKPTVKGNNVSALIEKIRINVEKNLSEYKDKVTFLRSEDLVEEYITKCIDNGVISIDTETTGLDCLLDEVVGSCLYTPNEKAIYIPHKHKSYITGQYLNNQISTEFMTKQYKRVLDSGIKVIMHNAKFDKRIIKSNFNVDLNVYWDTMLAAKCLDNRDDATLKGQTAKYINNTEKTYDFSKLFKEIDYQIVPVDVASMYAATDSLITYELYEFQKEWFKTRPEAYRVFMDLEMRVLPVVCDMENTGVALNVDYCKELSIKYHEQLDAANENLKIEFERYKGDVDKYNVYHPNKPLPTPLNWGSPTQLAIFFYDILGMQSPDKKKPRDTGEAFMSHYADKGISICKAILKYREINKLLTTYIDKMPETLNPKTKRIHATFNQVGADTGRFSSSDPNLQNIPSHNLDIRKMFTATDGYYLLGSDFSKQEPKLLAFYSGDKSLRKSFEEGTDIYSVIASMSFNVPYEDCLEFYPEGKEIVVDGKKVICGHKTHTNKQGKERRGQAKSILLGLMYGRGPASIAEQIHKSTKEAQEIINGFYKGFPTVKKWMDEVVENAKKCGYVETFYGRRRYIKDIELDDYTFELVSGVNKNFNPLDFDDDEENTTEVLEEDKEYYLKRLRNCRNWKDKERIKQDALSEGIKIHDNGGYIAEAIRKCVNTKIQGGAADQTKLAMINIANNEELKDLGFRLLIGVHDELIGEAPIENAKRCSELLEKCMTSAGSDIIDIKQECDVEISKQWYGESINL